MKSTPLKEIAACLGSATTSAAIVEDMAVDSRLVKRNSLFFALPGAKINGHTFLENAAASGACGAVVKADYRGPNFGLPLIHVPEVLSALQLLAKLALKKSAARRVAVTGSLGKTTTKDFIVNLLKRKFKVSHSPGNSNSQIGLPLSILNHSDEDSEILILEMGMTHPGQISKLVEIAPPEVAVVTTVALVHACNFESLEGIARSKGEIFSHRDTRCGIYHRDSDINGALSRSGTCQKISFSTSSPSADYHLQTVKKGMSVTDPNEDSVILPLLQVPGAHNRHNFLAAASVARYLGMEWEEIIAAIPDLQLPERRMQFIEKDGALFVNDAYNASEMSMKAALSSLPVPNPGGKKIAVLGGIVELGKFSEGCHRAVGEFALDHVDSLLCFGDETLPMVDTWKAAKRQVLWGKDRAEIVKVLREHFKPGDVVLLKGSNSKAVHKVLEEL